MKGKIKFAVFAILLAQPVLGISRDHQFTEEERRDVLALKELNKEFMNYRLLYRLKNEVFEVAMKMNDDSILLLEGNIDVKEAIEKGEKNLYTLHSIYKRMLMLKGTTEEFKAAQKEEAELVLKVTNLYYTTLKKVTTIYNPSKKFPALF
jgi:hypothetical protein